MTTTEQERRRNCPDHIAANASMSYLQALLLCEQLPMSLASPESSSSLEDLEFMVTASPTLYQQDPTQYTPLLSHNEYSPTKPKPNAY